MDDPSKPGKDDPIERDAGDIVGAGQELKRVRERELELSQEEASIDAELASLERRKHEVERARRGNHELEITEERRIADDLRDIRQADGHFGGGDHPMPEPCDVTVTINTVDYQERKGAFYYSRVVELAYPDFAAFPNATYSIMFERGPRANPEGVLSKGGSVEIADGMRFRVKRTGES